MIVTDEEPYRVEHWIELEFNALRNEILALGEAERSAVKFYIPSAAAVYTVPYLLLQHLPTTVSDESHRAFLWILCPAVAGLLILAMLQSLFWSVDGARRIGMYIKTSIEPRTNDGLRWESIFFEMSQTQTQLPSDSATIGTIGVIANLGAAVAAGFTFLHDWHRLWPAIAALVMAVPSFWILHRIYDSKNTRLRYSERFRSILSGRSPNGPAA